MPETEGNKSAKGNGERVDVNATEKRKTDREEKTPHRVRWTDNDKKYQCWCWCCKCWHVKSCCTIFLVLEILSSVFGIVVALLYLLNQKPATRPTMTAVIIFLQLLVPCVFFAAALICAVGICATRPAFVVPQIVVLVIYVISMVVYFIMLLLMYMEVINDRTIEDIRREASQHSRLAAMQAAESIKETRMAILMHSFSVVEYITYSFLSGVQAVVYFIAIFSFISLRRYLADKRAVELNDDNAIRV